MVMAKEEWGTKRVCPETGKRFYDLNNNPVISPYTGKEITLNKSLSTKIKAKTKSAESQKDDKFEETDELLNIDDDPENIVNQVIESPYTRVPIWKDNNENIIGLIHSKNLLKI